MSRRTPVPAESFTGTAVEVQCPTCGELERHQSMTFFRADQSIPIQPGEVVQVQALCSKREQRIIFGYAGGAQSYYIQLPKESK